MKALRCSLGFHNRVHRTVWNPSIAAIEVLEAFTVWTCQWCPWKEIRLIYLKEKDGGIYCITG